MVLRGVLFLLLLYRICFGKLRGKYKKVLYVFNYLKEVIGNVFEIDFVLKEVEKVGFLEDEVVLEILWMLK